MGALDRPRLRDDRLHHNRSFASAEFRDGRLLWSNGLDQPPCHHPSRHGYGSRRRRSRNSNHRSRPHRSQRCQRALSPLSEVHAQCKRWLIDRLCGGLKCGTGDLWTLHRCHLRSRRGTRCLGSNDPRWRRGRLPHRRRRKDHHRRCAESNDLRMHQRKNDQCGDDHSFDRDRQHHRPANPTAKQGRRLQQRFLKHHGTSNNVDVHPGEECVYLLRHHPPLRCSFGGTSQADILLWREAELR
jgi:hypothetical protein